MEKSKQPWNLNAKFRESLFQEDPIIGVFFQSLELEDEENAIVNFIEMVPYKILVDTLPILVHNLDRLERVNNTPRPRRFPDWDSFDEHLQQYLSKIEVSINDEGTELLELVEKLDEIIDMLGISYEGFRGLKSEKMDDAERLAELFRGSLTIKLNDILNGHYEFANLVDYIDIHI